MKINKIKKISDSHCNKKFSKLKLTVPSEEFTINNLYQIQIRLKTILKIIFECLKSNRKIFLVGFPDSGNLKFSSSPNQTNCRNFKSKFWINGLLSNSLYIQKYLNSDKSSTSLKKDNLKFFKDFTKNLGKKKVPDLIIYYNRKDNLNSIKESYKLKIPIILIFDDRYSHISVFNNYNHNTRFIRGLIITLFHTLFKSILSR